MNEVLRQNCRITQAVNITCGGVMGGELLLCYCLGYHSSGGWYVCWSGVNVANKEWISQLTYGDTIGITLNKRVKKVKKYTHKER
jgi:hypothetical protein